MLENLLLESAAKLRSASSKKVEITIKETMAVLIICPNFRPADSTKLTIVVELMFTTKVAEFITTH